MAKSDELAVSLDKKSFSDFKEGRQKYMIRVHREPFTRYNLRRGRYVTLKKWYSDEKINGTISDVFVGTPEEIFSQVYYTRIVPGAESEKEAIDRCRNALPGYPEYIAFKLLVKRKYI